MTCNPTTFTIKSGFSYRPTESNIDKMLELAYMAVNYHLKPTPSKHFNYRRHLVDLWNRGPECLKLKTRIRQVTFARGLVLNYLQTVAWFGCKKSAEIFGQHYSTALYWKEYIKDIRRQKFDSDEKDALMMFEWMVGGNGR